MKKQETSMFTEAKVFMGKSQVKADSDHKDKTAAALSIEKFRNWKYCQYLAAKFLEEANAFKLHEDLTDFIHKLMFESKDN